MTKHPKQKTSSNIKKHITFTQNDVVVAGLFVILVFLGGGLLDVMLNSMDIRFSQWSTNRFNLIVISLAVLVYLKYYKKII